MHSPPKIQNLRFTALTSQNKVLLRTFRWTTHGLIHRHAQNWTSFSPSPRKNKHLNQQPNKQNPTKRLSPKGHIRRHPRVSRGIQRNQIYRSRGAWTRNSSPRWWDHWRNHTTTTTTKIEKRRSPKKKQKQKKQWHSLNPSPWDSEDRRRRHNASKQASKPRQKPYKKQNNKKNGPWQQRNHVPLWEWLWCVALTSGTYNRVWRSSPPPTPSPWSGRSLFLPRSTPSARPGPSLEENAVVPVGNFIRTPWELVGRNSTSGTLIKNQS